MCRKQNNSASDCTMLPWHIIASSLNELLLFHFHSKVSRQKNPPKAPPSQFSGSKSWISDLSIQYGWLTHEGSFSLHLCQFISTSSSSTHRTAQSLLLNMVQHLNDRKLTTPLFLACVGNGSLVIVHINYQTLQFI